MSGRGACVAAVAAAAFAAPVPAHTTLIVGRNPKNPTLAVDSAGRALVTFTSGRKKDHVLIWGAVNARPPTKGKPQTAFTVDYSGGSRIKKPGYWKRFKSVCRRYTGPSLAWYVARSGCTARDGSYWALQLCQRMLPNLGFRPWTPAQAVYELHVSHWTGPLAKIHVHWSWAWSRYQQIFGQLTYRGKPVHGFGSTSVGNPTDAYGRNLYFDTYDSPYGKGWKRENSFLAQRSQGAFCYSLGPRPPYAGYPNSPPRMGPGSKYRLTVLGPGVTPAVRWEGRSPGDWNPEDAAKAAHKKKVDLLKTNLQLGRSACHS